MGLGKTLGEQRGRGRQYQVEIPASKKMPTNIALGNTLVVQESKIVGIKVQQLCIYNFAKLHFATQKNFNWLYQLIKSKNVFFSFDFIICFYSFFFLYNLFLHFNEANRSARISVLKIGTIW